MENLQTLVLQTDESGLEQAAQLILAGEVVAFPTETVYGLGGNALNEQAVLKIFQAKGRPADNPLILHIGSKDQITQIAQNIPDEAFRLMDHFWPGPLTLILPRKPIVPLAATGGLQTVAVRMPDHPVARRLIQKCQVPIAGPSANRSGKPSPTQAQHVWNDLAGRISAVLDGGECKVGLESTVLDLTVPQPAVLRPGAITADAIQAVLRRPVLSAAPLSAASQNETAGPKAPGMKYAHYAPNGELALVENLSDNMPDSRLIQELADRDRAVGLSVGILAASESCGLYQADAVIASGSRRRLEEVARNLYPALREFDQLNIERIYAETYPAEGVGAAIMNRLMKAAAGKMLKRQEERRNP